ncbi:MAG: ATP-binding protein [Chloroflexota bacterium]|nr:ATP-binding protein [Chloroflexota bacterium]
MDGQVTRHHLTATAARRAMHIAVLGKTGSGKSSFLLYLAEQDITCNRGFLYFDLHGDATPRLLRTINARERQERRHLSDKLIVIEPADPIVSVGLNPLEEQTTEFVRIAEVAQLLKERWHLDSFGARTDELLRNSLFALAANGLTLVELAPFLTDSGFRTACLKRMENAEIRQYFELRYDQASEPMRATMREPILNKTSAFTADPHFRHIVGQASTFSLKEAMDEGHWVLVNLNKGRLGEQALTLGSLILTVLKNALFTREKRSLFTVYCDEVQNFVAHGAGLETILSEARKFGVAVVSANQFLDQYSAEMRAAILAVGTHVFFQLSSLDAAQVSQALDGGKPLAERLKNLRQRHAIVKGGSDRPEEIAVPTVSEPQVDYTDLLNRSRLNRGRARAVIERAIAKRQVQFRHSANEVIRDWD